ncbi:MAG: hypothetical protein IPH72_30485 [Sandaracinaceae bacterium]|nr:hypothetical protein [Sandaracinaceae bacterium]
MELTSLHGIRDVLRVLFVAESEAIVMERDVVAPEPSHRFAHILDGLPDTRDHNVPGPRKAELGAQFFAHVGCRR